MLQERLIRLVLWDLVRHFKICKKVSATEQQCPTFHIAWTAWVSGVYYLPIQLTLTQPSIMEVVKIAMDIYLKDLSWKIWRYERKYAAPSLCILIWHPSVPPFASGKTTASPFPDPWSLAASVAPGLESYHSYQWRSTNRKPIFNISNAFWLSNLSYLLLCFLPWLCSLLLLLLPPSRHGGHRGHEHLQHHHLEAGKLWKCQQSPIGFPRQLRLAPTTVGGARQKYTNPLSQSLTCNIKILPNLASHQDLLTNFNWPKFILSKSNQQWN